MTSGIENEIKLRLTGPLQAMTGKLLAAGFHLKAPRVFESNVLFDTVDLRLRNSHELIRLRQAGHTSILTYKGPATQARHKSRLEIECGIGDPENLQQILDRLGYRPVFRYEKYRTEYEPDSDGGNDGVVTLDETPIGNFAEIEGLPDWVDGMAASLGFQPPDYIQQSYAGLYLEYCRERGIPPENMVFEAGAEAPVR